MISITLTTFFYSHNDAYKQEKFFISKKKNGLIWQKMCKKWLIIVNIAIKKKCFVPRKKKQKGKYTFLKVVINCNFSPLPKTTNFNNMNDCVAKKNWTQKKEKNTKKKQSKVFANIITALTPPEILGMSIFYIQIIIIVICKSLRSFFFLLCYLCFVVCIKKNLNFFKDHKPLSFH